MVSSASCSLVPPHMNPPIAHVPNPIRETSRFKPFTVTYSMALQPPNHCFNGRIRHTYPRRQQKFPRFQLFVPRLIISRGNSLRMHPQMCNSAPPPSLSGHALSPSNSTSDSNRYSCCPPANSTNKRVRPRFSVTETSVPSLGSNLPVLGERIVLVRFNLTPVS